MAGAMERISQRAADRKIPLDVHIDLTWRCNERCVHCYLDHDEVERLSLDDVRRLLDELAAEGAFFVTFSGGEIFLRRDLEQIVGHARARGFDIKLKTNAVLIREKDVAWMREHGVRIVQVSIYSHRAEVHDAITKSPGSLGKSVAALRMLKDAGIRTKVACVLMRDNAGDLAGVRALADEIGAEFSLDPTVTPHINGDRGVLRLNVDRRELERVFRDEALVGDVAEFNGPPVALEGESLDETPCSAGHTSCYISPRGDLFPCVQFPLACGNVRERPFGEIWRQSGQLEEVRGITMRDLTTCSSCAHGGSCTRCPGLAWMEGSMYGPSAADCEKSFVRTGVASAAMRSRAGALNLVQISR